jgi:hypothetical protein
MAVKSKLGTFVDRELTDPYDEEPGWRVSDTTRRPEYVTGSESLAFGHAPPLAHHLSFEAQSGATMVFPCPFCETEIILNASRIEKTVRDANNAVVVVCPCGSEGLLQSLEVDCGISYDRTPGSYIMSGTLLFTPIRNGISAGFPTDRHTARSSPERPLPSPERVCFSTSDELFDSITKKV